jgi:hypothetical protein
MSKQLSQSPAGPSVTYAAYWLIWQYGDLFEFVLLGRRVTVALGPKGNNLSLGGKVSQVSAEEAYTVSSCIPRVYGSS